MRKIFVLLFLIFSFVLPSKADIVRPDVNTEKNTIVAPAYADEIDPNFVSNNGEDDNIFDSYKNTTLHIFTAILVLLIVIASISIRKSIKGTNNDNANC